MEKRRVFKSTIFALLSAVLLIFPVLVGSVRAAGLWAYELGTPDMGTASAGRGALSEDASVALFNPAGMTKLDRSQLFSAAQGIWLNTEFDAEQSTFGGGNGGNAGNFIPAGSLAYVYSLNPRLKFGVGVGSQFGGEGWTMIMIGPVATMFRRLNF